MKENFIEDRRLKDYFTSSKFAKPLQAIPAIVLQVCRTLEFVNFTCAKHEQFPAKNL